jgi:hypothetical protein
MTPIWTTAVLAKSRPSDFRVGIASGIKLRATSCNQTLIKLVHLPIFAERTTTIEITRQHSAVANSGTRESAAVANAKSVIEDKRSPRRFVLACRGSWK